MTSDTSGFLRPPQVASVVWALLVNLPFLVAHPRWAPEGWPLLRSLAINLVLFWSPGWACLAPGPDRTKSPVPIPIGAILFSAAVFLGILRGFQIWGDPLDAEAVWSATWLLTNVILIVRLLVFRKPFSLPETADRSLLVAVTLFAASYPLYFWGATQIVPAQLDHDFEVQGTGLPLLERLEPLLLTDRGTHYYFAHPPLLHVYVAASFLYFSETDHLEPYQAASQRVQAVKRGQAIVPLHATVDDSFETIGQIGGDYLLQGKDGNLVRAPLERVELEVIEDHYLRNPHRLETRTHTIFLAAATVGFLGWWAGRLTGHWAWGLLAGAAYATSPEVFVRSSYGGYFGISNFAVLTLLWTAGSWTESDRRADWVTCSLAGFFAAIANHKLILLPAALAVFEVGRWLIGRRRPPKIWSLGHPAMFGFVAGTALFWAYGLWISPSQFWTEHVRTHLIDRVAHINPLGYGGYATMVGLWQEFLAHTGYILLPIASVALVHSAMRGTAPGVCGGAPVTMTMRSWLVWCLLSAVVFTVVDWRMTKHLMVLMIPLFLAPVVWSQRRPACRWIVGGALLTTLGWNLVVLQRLVADFSSLHVTPGW